jgi:hypothetical protein
VEAAIAEITRRAATLTGRQGGALVRQALGARVDAWVSQKTRVVGAKLGYQGKRDGTTIGLLKAPGDGRWEAFTCPNSLRDVEPPVNLVLRDETQGVGAGSPWQFGDGPAPADGAETAGPEPSGETDEEEEE